MQHVTKDSLLDGIQLFRVHTAAELLATVRVLPTMLEANPQVWCCHFGVRLTIWVIIEHAAVHTMASCRMHASMYSVAVLCVHMQTFRCVGQAGCGGQRCIPLPP